MNGFSRRPPVRRVAAVVALVAAAGVVGAGPASAAPRTAGAGAFHDSVGLVANDTYFDTPYVHWSTALDKARELGVRHLRLGVFSADNAGWDARHAAGPAGRRGRRLRARAHREPRLRLRRDDAALPGPRALAPRRERRGPRVAPRVRQQGGRQLGRAPERVGPRAGLPRARRREARRRPHHRPVAALRGLAAGARRPERRAGPRRTSTRTRAARARRRASCARRSRACARSPASSRSSSRTPASTPRWAPPAPVQPAVDERTAAVYTLRTVLEHFDGRGPAHVPPRARRRGERPQRRARELRPHAHGLLAEAGLHRPAAPARARGPGEPAGGPRARPRRRPAPARTCASSSSTAPTGPRSWCSGAPPASGTGARSARSR